MVHMMHLESVFSCMLLAMIHWLTSSVENSMQLDTSQ